MKLADKLPKLRKAQNFSQEQLAEKLSVSRQSVSKWESGDAYPEMEKIMQLCKILNCSLDALVDDDAVGNKTTPPAKFDLNLYVQEILDFITSSVNMFWSMNFGSKVKCLAEMCFYLFILVIASSFVVNVLEGAFSSIFSLLPSSIEEIFTTFFSVALGLANFIVIVMIIVHLFRIRYLDYFITIEDKQAAQKTVERAIEEKTAATSKNFTLKKNFKERIIIRDTPHQSYHFFYFVGRAFIFCFKIALAFCAGFGAISFVALSFFLTFLLCYSQGQLLFLSVALAIVGTLLLNYLVLAAIYNFIFAQKQHWQAIKVFALIGLLALGVGGGLATSSYLKLQPVTAADQLDRHQNQTLEPLTMDPHLVLTFIDLPETNLVVDETLTTDLKISLLCDPSLQPYLYKREFGNTVDNGKVYSLGFYNQTDLFNQFDAIFTLWQQGKTFIGNPADIYQITISGSAANLAALQNNYQLWLQKTDHLETDFDLTSADASVAAEIESVEAVEVSENNY